jgi:hypothetical protein
VNLGGSGVAIGDTVLDLGDGSAVWWCFGEVVACVCVCDVLVIKYACASECVSRRN